MFIELGNAVAQSMCQKASLPSSVPDQPCNLRPPFNLQFLHLQSVNNITLLTILYRPSEDQKDKSNTSARGVQCSTIWMMNFGVEKNLKLIQSNFFNFSLFFFQYLLRAPQYNIINNLIIKMDLKLFTSEICPLLK